MDQILKDLGLAEQFGEVLRTKGVNIHSFIKINQLAGPSAY